MSSRTRLAGGILGIVAALAVIPAYVVRSPEQPSTADEAATYFDQASTFVALNGILPILHVVAFLLFLAVLAAVVGSAGPGTKAARTAVLAGGTALVALTAAGFTAEIAYAVSRQEFPDVELEPGFATTTLVMALWLYHFAQAAGAVMMIGVGLASVRTEVLPRWFGYLSFLFAIVALLHTWLGVWSAYAGLIWIVLAAGVVMTKRGDPIPQ